MAVYIIIGIMLILSVSVVVFGVKSNDKAVRLFLAVISIIPWIILSIFMASYSK